MANKNSVLKKSNDPVVDGVIGGIADYFGVDHAIARIVAVLILISAPVGFVLFYIFTSIVMSNAHEIKNNKGSQIKKSDRSKFLGVILIGLGVMFMVQNIFAWFNWDYVWPLLIIAFGIYLFKGK